DLQPVLDAIARSAATFCQAENVMVALALNDDLQMRAHFGWPDLSEAEKRANFWGPGRISGRHPRWSSVSGRAYLDRRVVHVPDALELDETEFETAVADARKYGDRALLAAPLLRQGESVGVILLRRTEPGPFTDEQVNLVKTFSDQAVIAIENVRLFNETKEALDRQTAIAAILRAISASPTDVQPVLEAIAENAAQFCSAEDATVMLVRDSVIAPAAHFGSLPTILEQPGSDLAKSLPLDRSSVSGRAVVERRVIEIEDVWAATEEYPVTSQRGMTLGYRSVVAAPLIREGTALGTVLLRRADVRPFTPKQIDLLRTFADQAVIAIENVRLFNETKESLERQTAIAGILRSISESPTDVQPVLDTIAESAARFCSAEDATVLLVDGETVRTRAHHGPVPVHEQLGMQFSLTRGTVTGRSIIDRRTVQVDDLQAAGDDEYPIGTEQARRMGHRTTLATPLVREGAAVGAILLRRLEVKPFTEHQVDLVRTFADQAVIAIENVRLFNETKEALERQTAIAEILRVITASPTDVQPVLDAIAANAARFAGAEDVSVFLVRDEELIPASHHGPIPMPLAVPLDRGSVTGSAVLERRIEHKGDVTADDEFPVSRRVGELDGQRTVLAAPLMREGSAIGAIVLRRSEPRAFTDRQVDLVRTFADQAVIAIENVRLFNETNEALAQQTAVSDVLASISRSAFDLTAVLQTIVQRAAELCQSDGAVIRRLDGDGLVAVATYGQLGPMSRVGSRLSLDGSTIASRSVATLTPQYVEDIRAHPDLPQDGPRTRYAVPIVRDGRALGTVVLTNSEVR
ncbi:MAG TPA: GAF domain-containing protein, partial [Myxococcota bacterium]